MINGAKWLKRLRGLRVYRAKGGPAPHKPLLLLVVLEMAEQARLLPELLPLTPELAFEFCSFWSVVAHRRTQSPDVRMPFHHLQSDEVWSALNAEGGPSPDYRMTRFVRLDPEFRDFASDPLSRLQARSTLVKTYFQPDEQLSLYEAMGIPVPQEDELNRAVLGADAREASERGRDVRFRVNVVAAYNYTCSLTGYRLLTVSAGAIVDAAHIHQFAKSKNDDPRNGIALCKNAHWLFDNGLWSIDDDYTVLIAQGRFAEDSPDQRGLAHYKGLRVRLPSDTRLWPARTHLAWHRKNKFLGTGDE